MYAVRLRAGAGGRGRDPSGEGLATGRDRIHEPKPAVTKILFARTVGRNAVSEPFVQSVWVIWMFLLRVQSKCVPSVGQLPGEKIDQVSVLEAPAVIGREKGQLVMMLHGRKHMAGCSGMVRKCICHRCPEGTCATDVMSGMPLLGRCAPEGAHRGRTVPGHHWAVLCR